MDVIALRQFYDTPLGITARRLIANRLTELVMAQPWAATLAMAAAVVVGAAIGRVQGRKLARQVRAEEDLVRPAPRN